MAEKIKLDKDIDASQYTVEHWLVTEGEAVDEGGQVLSVRADGKSYIIHAPFDGILLSRNFDNGEAFNRDDSLGEFITHEEAGDIKVSDTLSETNRRILESLQIKKNANAQVRQPIHVKATPSARRLARNESIDLEFVRGTGPDGRIQLQDVVDYIKSISGSMPRQKRVRSAKVEYGLQPTPVAKRLAESKGIDTSKVPAPPEAVRIRKEDVERYARNPEGAEEEIKRAYGLSSGKTAAEVANPVFPAPPVVVGNLPEPTGKSTGPAIRLTTDVPLRVSPNGTIELELRTQIEFPSLKEPEGLYRLEAPDEAEQEAQERREAIRLPSDEPGRLETDGVILLNTTRFDEPLKLKARIPLTLAEPAANPAIRLPSDEPAAEGSGEAIELSSDYRQPMALEGPNSSLMLGEPKAEAQAFEPIRLPTDEASEVAAGEVIQLPIFDLSEFIPDATVDLEEGAAEVAATELLKPSPGRVVHLGTFVDLDLLKIFKEYKPEDGDIAKLARNYILSTIFRVYKSVFETETVGAKAVFLPDIERGEAYAFDAQTVDGIKRQLAAAANQEGAPIVKANDLIIVDLLAYDLSSVSGLVDPVGHATVYYSFIKDVGRFFIKPDSVSVRNVLNVTLEFDSDVMDPVNGVGFIQALRSELEKFKVNRDE